MNKLFTYGFGLMAGLLTTFMDVDAQSSTRNAPVKNNKDTTAQKKKEVTLAPELIQKLSETFVRDTTTQDLWLQNLVYFPDSTHLNGKMGNTMIAKLRISDREQVVLTGTDNGNRVFDLNEVEFVADYQAVPKAIKRLTSMKWGQNKYTVTCAYTDFVGKRGEGQVDFEPYFQMKDWVLDFGYQPKATEEVFEIFPIEQRANAPKKTGAEKRLERRKKQNGFDYKL